MPAASMFNRCVSEFVGTFMLVLTIGCNTFTEQTTWGGVSIGSVLTVMIYALGNSSGAHFNPAVSVALGLAKKEEWRVIRRYIPTQLVAAIVAASMSCLLFWGTIPLTPKPTYNDRQAGMVEMLYTFMLCFVVLNVAASKMHKGKNQFYGLAIGFVIVAGAYGAGNISGGYFNPAVVVALDITSLFQATGYSIVYLLFELVGAAFAVLLFILCRPEEKDDTPPPEPTQYDMTPRLVSEFLGTYMLVLTVGLNLLTDSVAGAFSIAASLMCMIFALGSVSEGHFNPAVTASIVTRGKFPIGDAVKYVLAQCAGGVGAAATYSLITGKYTSLIPLSPYSLAQAFVAEFVYTFVLAFVVLSVATVEPVTLSQYLPFAIGSCVTVGGYAIGKISGAYLNPAVSLGIASSSWFNSNGGALFLVLYVTAELLGGLLASQIFRLTRPSQDKPNATPKLEGYGATA